MKVFFALFPLCMLFACAMQSMKSGSPHMTAIRAPRETIGFTHSAEGIAKVAAHALEAEADRIQENRDRLGFTDETRLMAAISPHDDYVYAQQVYIHLYPYLKADHVILIGVAHRARDFPDCEGRLVFDAFDAWHGPYGPVPVSPLREDLLRALPTGDVLVSDEIHGGEHSLEAMVPFLQHFNRRVSIVPVLVPYMSRERLFELSRRTAGALLEILEKRGLEPGRDAALLISADCVHYGDQDWGGRTFADFGTDGAGYDQGVARDRALISDCLTGGITLEKLSEFYGRVVADDFHEYRITWCGRFSIPFGLAVLTALSERMGLPPPRGELLRYGTTLDPGRSDSGVPGLGVTARANLHHWVGFTSIAYP